MRRTRGLFRSIAAAAAAAMTSCGESPSGASDARGSDAASATPLRIAVVPKGTTHDFWKSIHAGAVKAQREAAAAAGASPGARPVEITFIGPEREDDREQQVSLVQNLVSARYDAIVLAPLDDRALVAPVRQATAAGIPVVVIDSDLAADVGTDFVSFVATDNERGGRLAGERMCQLLGGSGRVLMLRYQEGSASTTRREQGFADAATAGGLTLIDPPRYAGATRATAHEAAENLLTAHPDLAGIFCPNESSTFGMLLALRGRGLVGKVRFIGFDASEGLVDALAAAEIDALVVQNPVNIGYQGVRTALDALAGRPVPPRIDTGVALVSRDTMDSPEHRALLRPDLDQYLAPR